MFTASVPTGSPAAMGATPTSAPGNRSAPAGQQPSRGTARHCSGFTILELLLVVALIALTSSLVSLAIRDPSATRLEQEAVRLSALLEAARAEARAGGYAARWEPINGEPGRPDTFGFRFGGLPDASSRPTRWLNEGVSAQVIGAAAVQLGPEPVIAAQRIVLGLDSQQLVLATDGLAPFSVESTQALSER